MPYTAATLNGTNNCRNNFFLCFGFRPWFPHFRFSDSAKNFHFGASLIMSLVRLRGQYLIRIRDQNEQKRITDGQIHQIYLDQSS